MTNTNKNVATPNPESIALQRKLKPVRSLMEGTEKMRELGEEYLPKEEGETSEEYKRRLKRTFLYNYFKRTVGALVGKPFSKPINKPETLPEIIDQVCMDVDLQGNDLTTFGKALFEDAIQAGITYILIDYPKTNTDEYGVISVADERTLNLRPYWVHLKAENVIGWKSISVNGVHCLKQIRFKRTVTEPEDDYNDKELEQIVVINYDPMATESAVSFEVHQYNEKASSKEGQWMIVETGYYSGVTSIPLVPVIVSKTGFMTAEPPLLDLAHLQISHYQKQSDYDNIVHAIQVPILFGKGWGDKKGNSKMQLGSNRFWTTNNVDSDLKYVEHTGAAAKVGADSIAKLEDQMMKMSIRLLSERSPGGVTATEASLDSESAESALKSMVTDLTVSIGVAMDYTYEWLDMERPDDHIFEVNDDFGLMIGNDMIAQWLLKAQQAGILTKKTVGEEAKKVGYISEQIDIEEEIELASEESMAAASMMADLMDTGDAEDEENLNPNPPSGQDEGEESE